MASYISRLYLSRNNKQILKCVVYKTQLNYATNLEQPNSSEMDAEQEEKLRNITGMRKHFLDLMEHRSKPPDIIYDYQLHVKKQRKYFAKYGKASGIDAGICWPTKNELKEIIEENLVFEPPLEESLEKLRMKRNIKASRFKTRQDKIEYNMAHLEKWMADLKERKDKKENEVNAAKLKKEKLIEEVRQFFGYRLNPNDPKFQEILEKKEKEEKKAAKEAKKQDKFNKEMAKLAALAQLENPDPKSSTPITDKNVKK